MQITADMLRARLAECEAQRDQMLANANAFNGAAEECKYWLKVLDDQGALGTALEGAGLSTSPKSDV